MGPAEIEEEIAPEAEDAAPEPGLVKLREPLRLGKDADPIEEIRMKPNARAFRDFSLPMKEDGTIIYQPYALARIGLQMAGIAPGHVDKLGVADMNRLAREVMGFLG